MSNPTEISQAALEEYRQVVAQFRALTDIRFKLLAYLPLGTIATVFISRDGQIVAQPAVAAFALVATVCIAAYNKRNDQHYDELVARAAELEREELGLKHGSFAQRPTNWLSYGPVSVEHRWPIGLIYTSAAALWAYLFVSAVINGLPIPFRYTIALKLIGPALAVVCWLWLRSREDAAREKLRAAVYALKDQIVTKDSPKEGHLEHVASAIASKKKELRVTQDKAKRRVQYHWEAFATMHDTRTGSNLLGAVVDLPARWIEDVWTGRR
jgi:hypothetical protein